MNQCITPITHIDTDLTKDLANALVNFRAVLTSEAVQQMGDANLAPAIKKIIESAYAEARTGFGDSNDTGSIKNFLAKAQAQCDRALEVLASLPDHEGWEPNAPMTLEYTLGSVVWAMSSSYSAACITERMWEAAAPLRDKFGGVGLPWVQQTLRMLASCMRLATDDYDTPSETVTIFRKLRTRVLPLMTGDFSSLAVDAFDDITTALRTPAQTILMVGVMQDGMGVASFMMGPGIAVDDVSYLSDCEPILMLEDGNWKQITYAEAARIAR